MFILFVLYIVLGLTNTHTYSYRKYIEDALFDQKTHQPKNYNATLWCDQEQAVRSSVSNTHAVTRLCNVQGKY